MANCASQPGPTRVSGQAMIAALLMRMSTLRPVVEHALRERPHAVERAEVERVDPHALDPLEHLRGMFGPPGRDEHLARPRRSARARSRARGPSSRR